MSETALMDAARRCLPSAQGRLELRPLPGGGNNRVYEVLTEEHRYFLKHYFRHPGDPRDRLDAEFRFCAFAWEHGVRCVPRPVARDADHSLGLYEFIQGAKLAPDDVGPSEIQQALAFFLELQRHRGAADALLLAPASEACFSIADHVRMLDGRLKRLESLEIRDDVDREVRRFCEDALSPAWSDLREVILGEPLADRILPPEGRVISPSDFGFHNALHTGQGSLVFLDFEYAGWDDPAKLVSDFFSQVALPVPERHFDAFARAVAGVLGGGPQAGEAVARMELLLPLYRLKWCCIILGHFLPIDRTRKAFAGPAASAAKAEQLDKAKSLFASLRP